MTQTTTRISSQLRYKNVASYFKKSGLEVSVERADNDSFFITNSFALVRVPQHPDIPYTFFDAKWKRALFSSGKGPATETTRPDQQQGWDHFMRSEYHPLTLTHELHEVPGSSKSGTFYRKFIYEDKQLVQRASYFDKRMMDMLSPDLDELEGFGFEQCGHIGPMRVSAVNGYIAIVMPGHNIASR